MPIFVSILCNFYEIKSPRIFCLRSTDENKNLAEMRVVRFVSGNCRKFLHHLAVIYNVCFDFTTFDVIVVFVLFIQRFG